MWVFAFHFHWMAHLTYLQPSGAECILINETTPGCRLRFWTVFILEWHHVPASMSLNTAHLVQNLSGTRNKTQKVSNAPGLSLYTLHSIEHCPIRMCTLKHPQGCKTHCQLCGVKTPLWGVAIELSHYLRYFELGGGRGREKKRQKKIMILYDSKEAIRGSKGDLQPNTEHWDVLPV